MRMDMEFKFPMKRLMGTSFSSDLEDPPSLTESSKRARIFDDDIPVCTLENRENCYDPDSLKKAFHPLGIFSKCFGLFPCYDFAFVEKLNESRVRLIHILDYCYSALIFLLLTGGAILCTIFKPGIIHERPDENLDYFVKLGLVYATIFAGVQSLFIFPMKWNGVLKFVQLISNIDKILRFDGRMEERWFAKKVLFYLLGCLFFALGSFLTLFLIEGNEYRKEQTHTGHSGKGGQCFTDFLMAPIMTLALMALVIPTGLAVFFLNSISLRLEHFNRKILSMLKPYIPSCGTCYSFQDYGRELDEYVAKQGKERVLERKPSKEQNLGEDLEKMRILHCEIKTLGNCMSCIFGMHLVRDFLYSVVALVLYTYFLIYFIKNEGKYTWIIYAGHSIFIVLKLIVLAAFAQLINCQGMVLEGTLQRVSLRRLPSDSGLQVQAFMTAITNPITISASGFFNVNKALMTSIAASITTYFIILIQFKLNGGLVGSNGNATLTF